MNEMTMNDKIKVRSNFDKIPQNQSRRQKMANEEKRKTKMSY